MAQENLNTSTPNSGLGDFLRSAFIKAQNMFTELYSDKVDKETGKGLSANDFTGVLKNKLDSIASFAEVNVQSDFNQADETQDDFIKNKPTIPVLGDYLLNGGYVGTAQDLADAIALLVGLTTLTKNETNLVSMGDGFYSLPITLTGDDQVISVAIDGRSIPVQFESGNLINFDNNNFQTIKIKIG